MKSSYESIISKINQSRKLQILAILISSILISCILEGLCRHSIIRGFGFMFTNPIMSLLNVLIILITLSLALLTHRKIFIFFLMSTIWLIFGILNYIILCFRLTPLSAMDFYELESSFKTIPLPYTLKMILLIVVIIFIIILMIKLWRKSRKSNSQIKLFLIMIGTAILFIFIISNIAKQKNIISDQFDNLADAYNEYGFAYCLSNSIFEHGIQKPNDYTKERIDEIIKEVNNSSSQMNENSHTPNIIMVQLESFFDVHSLKSYTFSENPIPNFTKLKSDFSSGYLTVPSLGAGTVNTEFEVLTGMNTDFFGTGEYPYRTILQSSTIESICTNIEDLGYHSYAIHNNAATFYKRNEVYRRLGFDNFDSLEYMNNIEYNPIGWAKDQVLTGEILKALNADASRNFIYTISVQSHGEYLADDLDNPQCIKVIPNNSTQNMDSNENDIADSYVNQLEYYVNQLSETDKFIGDLVNALSDYEEPTVVVFFGDHLPPLSLDNEDLTHSKYQTEYILWSNYPMEKVRYDLNSYQLNAYLLDRIGIDNGILTKFHQTYSDTTEYEEDLKLLQYDMLYGKKYVYGETNPYLEKETIMGISEPEILSISKNGENLYIEGENFSPWSVIYIDNKPRTTVYVNQNTLYIPYEQISGKELVIGQVSDNKIILSKSKHGFRIN